MPKVDANAAAEGAMEMYDADGDGYISGGELDNAAPLKAGIKQLDENGDAKVSKDEIANRIKAWRKSQLGMMSVQFRVLRGGKPLPEVIVKLVPESYLGPDFKEATGVTDVLGLTAPSIAKEDRPFPDAPPGLQLGLYRIEVTPLDQQLSLPAKYNSATTLGHEISEQDRGVAAGVIPIELN